MSRASAEGAEYTKNIQGKKKKATFECQACTRKFATRSHLVRHSRVHTGERRYACDYPGCEMRCSRKDNLQQQYVYSLFFNHFFRPCLAFSVCRCPFCVLCHPPNHVPMATCSLDSPKTNSNSFSNSYRTHLVVNPRRANAQSMLTGAGSHDMETENTSSSSQQQQSTDMAHEFSSEKLTSPADLKPIITGNAALPSDPSQSQSMQPTESHSMAAAVMNGNPLHIHPALGGNLHHAGGTMNDENGPERDWSISPPPPLSSAYDYWYAHGCLPQAARNPASVSGSGSSGATSPEISNALELAPGQVPRQFVDSPTTYYHQHHQAPPPSHPPPLGSAYSSYDGERQQPQPQTQHGYPLATATFPTAADYQHPATTSQSHPHHQRSHSHSYSIGGNSSGGGGYTRLGGYQSASTSPHLPNAHLHGIHHHHHPHHPHHQQHQGQVPRQHSYDTTTTASTPTTATAVAVGVAGNVANVASYATNNSNPRSLAAVQGYHAPGPNTTNNSPTDRFSQSSSFHGHPHPQSHPGHGHSHSHSHSAGSSHAFQPPPAAAVSANGAAGQQRLPARETDGTGQSQSRPVTRHGSISTTAGFSMPVYPSHPHSGMTTYGVPVDMALQTTPTSATAGAGAYAESPIQRHSMPVSVASSPRMQPSQQSPSLVLPPIRYADSEPHQVAHHQHSHSAYGMMSMGGGHFSSGTPWDRVNVSDARALPPQGHLTNGGAMTR